mgnify:CR=1 FL=1|tara:strand:- start:5059 stop:5760 length:702 start_codon:yes stop_codon:yes gene_type:complete
MSGAAGLSAAKRRRAGSAQPPGQPIRSQISQSPSRYSQSTYNQYRQRSVNQVQPNISRENVTQGERVNFTILLKDLNTRLKKVEENLNLKTPVIPEENDLSAEKYDLLSLEISNLKKLVMDLQSVYVVQSKKIDEYCDCEKKKSNLEKNTTLIEESFEFKENPKSAVNDNILENKKNPSKENTVLKIIEKPITKTQVVSHVSKEVTDEITKKKVERKKESTKENSGNKEELNV